MITLFDPSINIAIFERIGNLNATSKALWGKMDVAQMLTHLYLSLQVGFGAIELRPGLLGLFFRGISRKILPGKKPFPKHLPADKKVLEKVAGDFYTEKQKLETALRLYVEKGPSLLSGNPHNILGNITPEESAFISYKHIDHQLRQFGV